MSVCSVSMEEGESIPSKSSTSSSTIISNVPKQSLSLDIKDILGEDDNDNMQLPVLLNVLQLEGPLTLSQEALRSWVQAHLDHSD